MTPRLSHLDAVTRVAPIFGGSLAAMAFEALLGCPIANGRGARPSWSDGAPFYDGPSPGNGLEQLGLLVAGGIPQSKIGMSMLVNTADI